MRSSQLACHPVNFLPLCCLISNIPPLLPAFVQHSSSHWLSFTGLTSYRSVGSASLSSPLYPWNSPSWKSIQFSAKEFCLLSMRDMWVSPGMIYKFMHATDTPVIHISMVIVLLNKSMEILICTFIYP